MSMPAGKYYVGDLCYVIKSRWDEVCDVLFAKTDHAAGEFVLQDGTRFAAYGTFWGDGSYRDDAGRNYPVDAGLIGCVLVSDLDPEEYTKAFEHPRWVPGHIIEFVNRFETGHDGAGLIAFGYITIDTDPKR